MLDRPRVRSHLPRVGDSRLVALVAPTGYGKTTVLRQWLAAQPAAARWVTIGDGNAAIATSLPARRGRAAVVIDDLETIDEAVAADALERALVELPARVTIVVASRRALPIRTARLRATGAMTLLTRDELALTVDELRALTGDRRARRIHAWTKGWTEPALRLASSGVAGGDDRIDGMAPLDDAFLGRVLRGISRDALDALLVAARCRGLTVDLATTVLGDPGAERTLEELVDCHALLSRDGEHFTIAPALADALRRHQRGKARCHRVAGRWYREHARPADALEHAAAARDVVTIGAVLGDAVDQVMASDDVPRLARWTATVTPPAQLAAAARQRVGLASAVLRARDRRAWAPTACGAGPAIVSAVRAIDLLRSGQLAACAAAVSEVNDAIDAPESIDEALRPTLAAMVAVIEFDIERLMTWSVDDDRSRRWLRIADGARWPWVVRWAYGQRALDAVLRGDLDSARAFVARVAARDAEPGDGLVDQGGFGIAAAFIAAVDADTDAARQNAIGSLTDVIERADRYRTAASVVARYALHRVLADSGDRRAARAMLSDADARRDEFADVGYLTAVRARLTDLLSPRERLVVEQLGTDRTVAEIAAHLIVSPHTVRSHIRSIYRKLDVSSRAQVVAATGGLARNRSTAP